MTPAASIAGKSASSVGRVVTLTVIDQGASSVSNFGLSVLVARGSDARDIGVFAIVVTTYILCQGLVRSVTSDCLLTRSGAEAAQRVRFERAGYLFAFLAASGMSLVLLGISAVVGSPFAIPFIIFAITFPLMALQDFSRYIGISRQDPAYAIRLDVAWIVVFAAAVIGLRVAGLQSLPWLFGAWTGAGALVGLWTAPTFISVRNGAEALRFWIASEWSVGVRFAGQFLVGTFGTYGVFYLLIFVLSIEAIGLIKVTQLALAPIVVLFTGVQSALVSIISRKMQENRQQAVRFLNAGAVLMTLAMALWTVAVYVAPVKALSGLFGHSWVQARPYMLWIGFATALGSVFQAYLIGLRAMRSARELLRLTVIMAPFLLVFPLVGAKVEGIRGMAVGLAAFYVIYAAVASVIFARAARHFAGEKTAEPMALDELAGKSAMEPTALSEVLAREGLVAPISFADMFARHQGVVEPVAPTGRGAGHRIPRPISLPPGIIVRREIARPTIPTSRSGKDNGAEPISSFDPLASRGISRPTVATSGSGKDNDAQPISFADLFARREARGLASPAPEAAEADGKGPIPFADLFGSKERDGDLNPEE
jgi:O-antigen/teichoic acid export membrane protein